MKKIEIVVEVKFFDELITLMNEHGIFNYSALEIVRSHGPKHGDSVDYGFMAVNKNYLLICICTDEQFASFKTNIVPSLNDMHTYAYGVSNIEQL